MGSYLWNALAPTRKSQHQLERRTGQIQRQRPRTTPCLHKKEKRRRLNYILVQTQLKHSKRKQKNSKKKIPQEYHEFLDIFSDKAASQCPERKIWDHKIELKPEFIPRSFPIYNLNMDEEQILKEFIKENLEKGYIRESKSPMASSFFFVGKKDGKKRPCQDYRHLNAGTVKDVYPLPLISDIMDKVKGKKFFTKMDIRWGYNNVRIAEGDEWKAAFKTKLGLFEPLVMFFGLCNSPATFQRMMDHIFVLEIDGHLILLLSHFSPTSFVHKLPLLRIASCFLQQFLLVVFRLALVLR